MIATLYARPSPGLKYQMNLNEKQLTILITYGHKHQYIWWQEIAFICDIWMISSQQPISIVHLWVVHFKSLIMIFLHSTLLWLVTAHHTVNQITSIDLPLVAETSWLNLNNFVLKHIMNIFINNFHFFSQWQGNLRSKDVFAK